MKTKPSVSVLAVFALAVALAGCQKSEEAAQQESATQPAPAATESVAKPETQMPPSDAAIKPDTPAGGPTADSGSASGTSQDNPNELTKREESTAMPLPGQVNNHSTIDGTQK